MASGRPDCQIIGRVNGSTAVTPTGLVTLCGGSLWTSLRVRTGHCPVTAEVPGEGSELVAAGVEREARPCASPARPAGGRPLLPVRRDREPPQRVRQHGADGGGGYG